MNAETFFKHFETFAEAPNGVAKLREMILQLAVLGKLVSQDPDDEPAQVAVDRANTTRLSNGAPKATQRSCFSGSNNDPKNSDLPRGWANMVLDSVCSQVTDGEHLTPQREFHGEIPLVTAKNVRDGFIDLTTTDFVSRETAEKCWKRCCPIDNDILMVCVGATTGRLTVLVTPSPSVIVRSVALFRPIQDLLVSEYLAIVLRSPVGQSQIWSSVKQSAQPCLYISKSKRIPVALPPRAEQKRIVSKVDQLMKLCDELDSRQTARRESRMRLVGATLDRVVSTSSTAEFPKHVNRLRDQFDRLFDTPTTIPQLRQTILQLAVQGKLVPQDPNDEPARLNAKVDSTPEPVTFGCDDNSCDIWPFQVPINWRWIRLRDTPIELKYGTSVKCDYGGVGVPVLRIPNVVAGRVDLADMKYGRNRSRSGNKRGRGLVIKIGFDRSG